MKVNGYKIPENVYYNKDHSWVHLDKNGYVTVGITDYAQKMLRELIFIFLPKKGMSIKISEVFGTVESIKAISELYSPLTGEIVEVNEKLRNKPIVVNEDPYKRGWIIVIRTTNSMEESKKLLNSEQYAAYLKGLIKSDKSLLINRWKERPQ